MKYTIIKDLTFYEPTKDQPYDTVVLKKGTEVDVLTRRQVSRLDYMDQKALKRMKKKERNLMAFMWKGALRTAVKDKDMIQSKVNSRETFLEVLLRGKD